MKLFTIYFNRDSYLYEQLYDYIVEKIYDKTLKPGEKLPSKKKLANHLNISENTVDKAYSQLLIEGYIYSVERKGHFIEKLQLPIRPMKSKLIKDLNLEQENYLYDFSYAGVDSEIFDSTTFIQAFKEISKNPNFFTDKSPLQGSPRLREAIRDYLFSSRGFSCSIDQMVISSGTEGLYQLLFQLFNKKIRIGLENPGYQRIAKYIRQINYNYFPISLLEDGIDIDELKKKKINLVSITPSHQFPSGIIYPMKKRLELLKWSNEYNSFIVEDDYDSEFRYHGKPIPALKSVDTKERVIYMGSFSKSFSPALRISYMILPSYLMEEYEKIKHIYPCPVSNFTQEALAEWIKRGDFYKHLNKTRTHYRQKRDKIVKCIEDSNSNVEVYGMDSGLHMILEIKDNLNINIFKENLKKSKIKIKLLDDYYYDKSLVNHKLLLGFSVLPINKIEESVDALFNAIKNSIL
ncbi:MAG: PLP-dependent aminotransferase family protein [Lagierella massiliensis]|nr:PLP-dependent aminotransferase family protein [Lagierella massiliensis]